MVADLTRRLRDEVDVNRLANDWIAAITETMKPSTISVWIKP